MDLRQDIKDLIDATTPKFVNGTADIYFQLRPRELRTTGPVPWRSSRKFQVKVFLNAHGYDNNISSTMEIESEDDIQFLAQFLDALVRKFGKS